jgi:hypothetical protein
VSVTTQRIGLILIGMALILPLWIVKYPPLIDYPNHLARAYVLHHMNDPQEIFSGWYAPDWGPNPYLVVDVLLQALQYPFGIYVAGRLLLTLCVLAVPLATWLFLRQASPGNEFLALWALTVAYDCNFLMGFLSFQFSMALCLVVVAGWLAFLKSPKPSTWLLLLLLVTVLYFTHIGGFGVAGIVLVLYTWMTRRRLLDTFQAAALFLPGFAFFTYMKTHSWAKRGFDYSSWHFSAKLVSLTAPFRGYSHLIDVLSLLVFAGCLLLALRKHREIAISRVWLVIAAAIVAVHWVVPERYGDLASIDTRFPPFAFLLALAIPSLGKHRNLWLYGALSVFLVRTAYTTVSFQSEQKKLETLAAGIASVPEHARVWVCVKPPPPQDLWVQHGEYHFWAYGVISRGWVSPSLFHQSGVQPLVLTKVVYLDDDPDGSCAINQTPDGRRLRQDYDFVWSYDVPTLDSPLSKIGRTEYAAGKLKIFELRGGIGSSRPGIESRPLPVVRQSNTSVFANRRQ